MKQQQQWQWQWHQQQSTHSPGYGDHKRSRQTNNSKNNNNNDKQTLRKKIKRWKRKTADKKKSESRMCTEMTFHFLFQPSPKKVRGFPTTTTTASLSQASKRIFLLQNIVAHTKIHTHNIFKVISPLHSTSFTLCMHTNFTHLYMQSAGIRFSYNDSGQIVESWCPFSPWDKFIANSQTSINVIIRWWNWGGKTDALYMPIHNGAGNGNVEKCKCCNSGGDGTVPRRREKREERKERWNAFGMARWLRTCSGYNMKNESWKRMFSHLLTRVNKMTLLSNWTSNIHKRLYGKAYGMMVFFSALEWAIGFKPRSKIYMHIIYFHESRKGFGMMLIEWHMWI